MDELFVFQKFKESVETYLNSILDNWGKKKLNEILLGTYDDRDKDPIREKHLSAGIMLELARKLNIRCSQC